MEAVPCWRSDLKPRTSKAGVSPSTDIQVQIIGRASCRGGISSGVISATIPNTAGICCRFPPPCAPPAVYPLSASEEGALVALFALLPLQRRAFWLEHAH